MEMRRIWKIEKGKMLTIRKGKKGGIKLVSIFVLKIIKI